MFRYQITAYYIWFWRATSPDRPPWKPIRNHAEGRSVSPSTAERRVPHNPTPEEPGEDGRHIRTRKQWRAGPHLGLGGDVHSTCVLLPANVMCRHPELLQSASHARQQRRCSQNPGAQVQIPVGQRQMVPEAGQRASLIRQRQTS